MIIEQVSRHGRQAIMLVGELVPITDDAFLRLWNVIVAYKTCHDHLMANCNHEYTIEINGRELPQSIKNQDQLQEWYEF